MAEGGGTLDNSSDCTDYLCTSCSEDGDELQAVNYCTDCKVYFCSKCIKTHNRLPATKTHKLTDLLNLKGEPDQPISESTMEGLNISMDTIAPEEDLDELRSTDTQSAIYSEITEEEKESIKTSFLMQGVNGIKKYIEEKLDKWKAVEINIGITGNSGTGKSSFINVIRGLNADDDGAAAVGAVETTKQRKKYLHPNNRNCAFWDLPGIGTPTFKAETYLKDVKFETYDFFIILIHGRFRENDMLLVESVHAQGKRCYLVRSHIDSDLAGEKKAHRKSFNRDAVLSSIRDECVKIVKKRNLPCKVYLIDNYNTHAFDFDLLLKDIMENSLSLYKEAFAMSMTILTNEVIEEKRNALLKRVKRRITAYQFGFGALNLVTVGLSHFFHMVEIFSEDKFIEETNEFRAQFGLTDEDLRNHANALDMTLEELRGKLHCQESTDLNVYKKSYFTRMTGYHYSSSVATFPIFSDIVFVRRNLKYIVSVYELFLKYLVEDAKTIHRLETAYMVEIVDV